MQEIKGYSDIHARDSSRFDRLLAVGVALHGRPGVAQRRAELRELAMSDVTGKAFERGVLAAS